MTRDLCGAQSNDSAACCILKTVYLDLWRGVSCRGQSVPLILGRMSVMNVPSRVSSEDSLDTVSDPSGKS